MLHLYKLFIRVENATVTILSLLNGDLPKMSSIYLIFQEVLDYGTLCLLKFLVNRTVIKFFNLDFITLHFYLFYLLIVVSNFMLIFMFIVGVIS